MKTILKKKNEFNLPTGCDNIIYDSEGNEFCRCGFIGSSTGVYDLPSQRSIYLCNKCSLCKPTTEKKE